MSSKQLEKAVDAINAYVDQVEAYADNLTLTNLEESNFEIMRLIVHANDAQMILRKIADGATNNDNAYDPFLALDTLRRKRDAEAYYADRKMSLYALD